MRLKAIRNFWLKNEKRGCMEQITAGQEFELDTNIEAELIDQLVRDLKAEPCDYTIPEQARYIASCALSYQDDDGWHHIEAKQTVSLPRSMACRLMAEGKIKPENPEAWFPRKSLQMADLIKKGEPKRMFDKITKPNWITRVRK